MFLQPGKTGRNSYRDPGQELQYSLAVLTLDGAQNLGYEALSYVWHAGNYYGFAASPYPEEMYPPNTKLLLPCEYRIYCHYGRECAGSINRRSFLVSNSQTAATAIRGPEPLNFLQISPNLIETLSRLRYPSQVRLLWVDSVCINQKDQEKRNSQYC
jgi:hypothetical protein